MSVPLSRALTHRAGGGVAEPRALTSPDPNRQGRAFGSGRRHGDTPTRARSCRSPCRPDEHGSSTISARLKALHRALVFGLPYQIFVCALGLVIAMLSVIGVYFWWKMKKRNARRFHKAHGASVGALAETPTAE